MGSKKDIDQKIKLEEIVNIKKEGKANNLHSYFEDLLSKNKILVYTPIIGKETILSETDDMQIISRNKEIELEPFDRIPVNSSEDGKTVYFIGHKGSTYYIENRFITNQKSGMTSYEILRMPTDFSVKNLKHSNGNIVVPCDIATGALSTRSTYHDDTEAFFLKNRSYSWSLKIAGKWDTLFRGINRYLRKRSKKQS